MHINLFGVIILVINLYSCITLLFNPATVTPVVLSTHWKVRGAIPAYSGLHAVSLKYPWTR